MADDENQLNISEISRRTGISRPTLIKWKKEGEDVLASELAKKGFGIEPGEHVDDLAPNPETGEVPMETEKVLNQRAIESDKQMAEATRIINEKFGQGSAFYKGAGAPKTEFVSTGVPEVDQILGGGVALGRLMEIFGKESSGKTTLALHMAAQFRKLNRPVVYLDAEHAIDSEYAKRLGFDTTMAGFTQPSGMEECGEFLRSYCRTIKGGLIIVDSIAAMHPTAEYANDVGAANMGLKARILGQIIRMIYADAYDNKTAVVFINQLRTNLQSWGNPEYTPGGHALKFAASQRLEMKPKMNKDDEIKRMIKFKCVKNKVAMPLGECEIPVYFGEGFIKK